MPISRRAGNKLRAYSSFEKWEQRTLKLVENTRKVSFYLSMQYKYHQKTFFMMSSEMIVHERFPEECYQLEI